MDDVRDTTHDAHREAVAAMLELRTAGARLLDVVTEAQTLAPHHLVTLHAVAGGSRSLGGVAAVTDRHVSSVSRTIDQLVNEGLVERAEDPDDRRQVVLRTTPAGDSMVRRFEGLDAALLGRIVRVLDSDEAAVIAQLMRRMAAVASEVYEELSEDPDALARLG